MGHQLYTFATGGCSSEKSVVVVIPDHLISALPSSSTEHRESIEHEGRRNDVKSQKFAVLSVVASMYHRTVF